MLHSNNSNLNSLMYNSGVTTGWSEEQQQRQPSSERITHPEWGVMKEQEFRPLTLKHQKDLENLHQTGNFIKDFYFWQANLGGYCMADMIQSKFIF